MRDLEDVSVMRSKGGSQLGAYSLYDSTSALGGVPGL